MPLTQSIQDRFVQWRKSCRCLSPQDYLIETGQTMEELCGLQEDCCPYDEIFVYDGGVFILGKSPPTNRYNLILDRDEYESGKISDLEPILFEWSREDGYRIPAEFMNTDAIHEIHKWEDWMTDEYSDPCFLYFPHYHRLEAYRYTEDRMEAVRSLNERTRIKLVDHIGELKPELAGNKVGRRPLGSCVWIAMNADLFGGYGLTATGWTKEEARNAFWDEYCRKSPVWNRDGQRGCECPADLEEKWGVRYLQYEIGHGYFGDDDVSDKINEVKLVTRK